MDNFKENLAPEEQIPRQEETPKKGKIFNREFFGRIFTDKKKIIIIIVAGIIITGGILAWQFWLNLNPSFILPLSRVEYSGTVEGSLSYPSDFIPSDMKVCAENQQTKKEYCTEEHIQDEKYIYREGYKINVPAGDYFVYAALPNREGYRAYYSEFVTCGMSAECLSHEPILISVKAGDVVTDIDPMDWYTIVEQEQKNETTEVIKSGIIDQEISAEKVKYELIYNLTNINDKLAYVVETEGKSFVVYDGKEGKKYSIGDWHGNTLFGLTEISEKLTYEVALGQVIDFFVHGDQKIEGYSPTEINGKLAYVKNEENGTYVIYEDEEAGQGSYPVEINGKLAYTMLSEPGIVYNGEIYGSGIAKKGPSVEVNGKLTYVAKKENKEFVMYGEKECRKYELSPDLTPGNYRVYSPTEVADKLAYRVRYGNQTCVVYDEQEQKKYDGVNAPVEINGKLAYVAEKDGKYFVVYDKKEGEKYHRIYNLSEINKKLTYVVLENNEFFAHGNLSGRTSYGGNFIIYGNQKIGEEYDEVLSPIELDEELVYAGRKGDTWYIVKRR